MNKKLFITLVIAMIVLPIFSMVYLSFAQVCYEDLSCNSIGDIVTQYHPNGTMTHYKFNSTMGLIQIE